MKCENFQVFFIWLESQFHSLNYIKLIKPHVHFFKNENYIVMIHSLHQGKIKFSQKTFEKIFIL